MLKLDKEKVRNILADELGYSLAEADVYLRDYPLIHDELVKAVKQWLEDRSILDVSIFGLSISGVMKTRRCHFLMAVRNLNRLLDDDLSPEQRERLVEILRKPVIRW